jgi:hypothetical protein
MKTAKQEIRSRIKDMGGKQKRVLNTNKNQVIIIHTQRIIHIHVLAINPLCGHLTYLSRASDEKRSKV